MHSVCPEYKDDITSALAVCLKAKVEIPLTLMAFKLMPGDFNLAARALFHDRMDNNFYDCTSHTLVNLNDREAEGFDPDLVFHSTVAIWSCYFPDEWLDDLDIHSVEVEGTYLYDLELVSVKHPTAADKIAYGCVLERYTRKPGTVEPAALVKFKHAAIEDGYDRSDIETAKLLALDDEIFFLEESIVGTADNPGPLLPGMKIRAVVCELDCGLKYLMDVSAVKPSMHTFLPQELMLQYKEPVANERPAPSVKNPEADEEQLENLIEDEVKAEEE